MWDQHIENRPSIMHERHVNWWRGYWWIGYQRKWSSIRATLLSRFFIIMITFDIELNILAIMMNYWGRNGWLICWLHDDIINSPAIRTMMFTRRYSKVGFHEWDPDWYYLSLLLLLLFHIYLHHHIIDHLHTFTFWYFDIEWKENRIDMTSFDYDDHILFHEIHHYVYDGN
jgi:hypothetical protein